MGQFEILEQDAIINTIMQFFIPHAETPDAAERKYQTIRITAQNAFPGPISKRRIFRIAFMHQSARYEIEVGKKANFHEVNDEVMAIFESESTAYLICTPSRGVDPRFPMPIIVGISDTIRVEDFET